MEIKTRYFNARKVRTKLYEIYIEQWDNVMYPHMQISSYIVTEITPDHNPQPTISSHTLVH